MRAYILSWPTLLLSLLINLIQPYYVNALNSTTMAAHLRAGANLLGTFQQSNGNLSKWMASYNDSTYIQDMNIPGTHDSLTWSVTGIESPYIQTQDLSLFDQLNNGVRFVDLRLGILSNKIRLYHGSYLLDANAQLVDILWGLYHWLDNNPTETILVSMKVDNGNNTATLQQQIYNLMTNPEVSDYWVQNSTLWTLGQARHKLVPIQRFDISSDNIVNFNPPAPNLAFGWSDNRANFSINYAWDSSGVSQLVYIEDLYNPNADDMEDAVQQKVDAIKVHLQMAMNIQGKASAQIPGQWYIAFASGYNGITTTPEEFAVGSSIPEKIAGVNSELLPFLVSNRGNYFGVLLFDFYGHDLRMANATLGWEVSGSILRSFTSVKFLSLSLFITTSVLYCL